jgi:Indolepyruvate ferredoxin oxidoreductase, alpha and beta subunits
MAHIIKTDLCVACGTCLDECPTEAIKKESEMYLIDSELCADCGVCVESCPSGAIEEMK